MSWNGHQHFGLNKSGGLNENKQSYYIDSTNLVGHYRIVCTTTAP